MDFCALCNESANRRCVNCMNFLCDKCSDSHYYCPKCGGFEFDYL